jgi:hypothetical protein
MIAAKYHDDLFYNNAYYAKLGGIPLPELNLLEIEFLQLNNFEMFVHNQCYEKYFHQLKNYQFFMNMQQQQQQQMNIFMTTSPVCSPITTTTTTATLNMIPHQTHSLHHIPAFFPCETTTANSTYSFSPHRQQDPLLFGISNTTTTTNNNHHHNHHLSNNTTPTIPTNFYHPQPSSNFNEMNSVTSTIPSYVSTAYTSPSGKLSFFEFIIYFLLKRNSNFFFFFFNFFVEGFHVLPMQTNCYPSSMPFASSSSTSNVSSTSSSTMTITESYVNVLDPLRQTLENHTNHHHQHLMMSNVNTNHANALGSITSTHPPLFAIPMEFRQLTSPPQPPPPTTTTAAAAAAAAAAAIVDFSGSFASISHGPFLQQQQQSTIVGNMLSTNNSYHPTQNMNNINNNSLNNNNNNNITWSQSTDINSFPCGESLFPVNHHHHHQYETFPYHTTNTNTNTNHRLLYHHGSTQQPPLSHLQDQRMMTLVNAASTQYVNVDQYTTTPVYHLHSHPHPLLHHHHPQQQQQQQSNIHASNNATNPFYVAQSYARSVTSKLQFPSQLLSVGM